MRREEIGRTQLEWVQLLGPIYRVTWSIENDKFMSSRKPMGRSIGNDPSATVSYFGSEIVVSEAVREPTTIAGAILGLTSIVGIKKRQKIASN